MRSSGRCVRYPAVCDQRTTGQGETLGPSPSGKMLSLGRRAFDNPAKTRRGDFPLTKLMLRLRPKWCARRGSASRCSASATLTLSSRSRRRGRHSLVLRQSRKGDSGPSYAKKQPRPLSHVRRNLLDKGRHASCSAIDGSLFIQCRSARSVTWVAGTVSSYSPPGDIGAVASGGSASIVVYRNLKLRRAVLTMAIPALEHPCSFRSAGNEV